jgi:hypothetical protein
MILPWLIIAKAMELRKDLPTAQGNILEVICYDKKDYDGAKYY